MNADEVNAQNQADRAGNDGPAEPMEEAPQESEEAVNLKQQLAQAQAELAAKSLAELSTSQTATAAKDLSIDSRIKIFGKPDKFNSSSKQLSIHDWLQQAVDNLKKVGYAKTDWGDILASWLSDKDKKRFNDQHKQLQPPSNNSYESVSALMICIWGDPNPDMYWFDKLCKCTQHGRSITEYINDFTDTVAHLSAEGQPTQHNQIHQFLRGLDHSFKQSVGGNPVTQKVWLTLSDAQQAARNHGALLAQNQAAGASSGQKRRSEGVASGTPQKKHSASKSDYVPKPGTRSSAEQEFLRKENLCFHCVTQEPSPHRSKDCPHKKKPPGQMPSGWNKSVPQHQSELGHLPELVCSNSSDSDIL